MFDHSRKLIRVGPLQFDAQRPRPQLSATALHILPRGVAQLGEHAAPVQAARHPGRPLPARAPEVEALDALDAVVGDQVHHRVFAGQQAGNPFQLCDVAGSGLAFCGKKQDLTPGSLTSSLTSLAMRTGVSVLVCKADRHGLQRKWCLSPLIDVAAMLQCKAPPLLQDATPAISVYI